MVTALKNKKKAKPVIDVEAIARSQGVKPFNINEPFDDPGITDEELEEFLNWRREIRKADVEAQKAWRP